MDELAELQRALAALEDPTWCEGTLALDEAIALILPDGDMVSADEPQLVPWLLAHGEPAPFGHNNETVIDPAVRAATRLTARGAVRIDGFAPARILPAIEATLSPHRHLAATLTDVLVYAPGGHFATHKDTPTDANLVGTLIVGLPIEHEGGAFVVEYDTKIAWSGAVDRRAARWLAMFTDVDHAVEPVTSGARVTLVYALHATERPRVDEARDARMAALREAIAQLRFAGRSLSITPLMIACARHVIAPDAPQPQHVDALRGQDREIANAFADAGYRVAVRTCLAARDRDFETEEELARRTLVDGPDVFLARLREPLLQAQIDALLRCIVFDRIINDGCGPFRDDEIMSIEPWIEGRIAPDRWIFRRGAAATFLREIEFSGDGFVGNSGGSSYLYKLAALELTR